jgi:CRISPR-associated protein Cas1
LCLPDEVNAALERSDLPPRRIVPGDPDHRPMYVTEQGACVGVSGGRVVATLKKQELASVRLVDVSHLCVYGHVQVSTEALTRLWARRARHVVQLRRVAERMGATGDVPLRRVAAAPNHRSQLGGVETAAALIAGKILNSRTLLMRNAKRPVAAGVIESLKALELKAAHARGPGVIAGLRGNGGADLLGVTHGHAEPARVWPGAGVR